MASGPKRLTIVLPDLHEDRVIVAAAVADPDAQPLTDAQLASMVPLQPKGKHTANQPSMPAEPLKNSVHPSSRAEWRAWLEENHTRGEGVWFVSYKKVTGKPRIEYEEAVEEALCFGWIDSKAGTVDDERSRLWMSPRKPKTGWSKPNKERVERLIAAGRMAPAGLAKIEAAKEDGSWTALDAVEALEVPPDLAEALARFPAAANYFEAFPRSVKRNILEWIGNAKTAGTRAKRIDETARLAADNVRANQWQKPAAG